MWGTSTPLLSGLISRVRFREAVSFTFCFMNLCILGFVTYIYCFYFIKIKTKKVIAILGKNKAQATDYSRGASWLS